GVLDVLVGAAFVLGPNRGQSLRGLGNTVLDVARHVGVTMGILSTIPPDVTGKPWFDSFLDRLHGFGRFDTLPVDLNNCVGELLNVLGRPTGSLRTASQVH